ncbi:AraC family transcriptional regulator ligand-binding domain-containing protein [Bradyrhizobium sp. SRL28]|nr:AraC family transcriptional regulator ligand-binding domain-containing protein [Bradyrhizobium sp. SRL28]
MQNGLSRFVNGATRSKKVEIVQAKVKNCHSRSTSSWLNAPAETRLPARRTAAHQGINMQPVRPEPAAAANDVPGQVRGAYGSASDLVTHSMLGIGGLFEEMASYGISRAALIANTGIELAALDDPAARMTHQQKILLFRNVQRLSPHAGVGLFAGQRQRL